jgi:branched-chain amino acid transport system permease protein
MARYLKAWLNSTYGGLLLLGALIVFVPLLTANNFHLRIAALVWTFGFAAIGLNILMGEAGQVSLGHAACIGFGSYAVAILPARWGIDPLISIVIGLLASCAAAWLIGRPILKLKGHYLSVATLGLGYLVSLVIVSEPQLTGGPDGMPVPRITVAGVRLAGAATWYWISAGVLLIGAVLALNLKASPNGRALRALYDSEVAAGVLGIDVAAKKLAAFVIAAGYASITGSMLALMNGFASPSNVGFLQSVELVTMVVMGGTGSVFGALVGAAVLVVIPQLLTFFHEDETALIGLIIMLFMIFLRDGIVPSLARLIGARLTGGGR